MALRLAGGVRMFVVVGVCGLCAVFCLGQAAHSGGPGVEDSRVDLYGGYGYLHPVGSDIGNHPYGPEQPGFVGSVAGYVSPYFGVEAEGSVVPRSAGYCVDTAQGGVVGRLPLGRFVPFAHAVGGGARVGGPASQPCTWGWGVTAGVGMDYVVRGFENRLALRLAQADFQYSQVDYGPLGVGGTTGGVGEVYAYRLSGGLVLRLGTVAAPAPVMYGCVAEPANVFAGDPVTVDGRSLDLDTRKKYVFAWASSGGTVRGTDASATIGTGGLVAGEYMVSGKVMRAKGGKLVASCTAGFTVKAFEPPTISCTAEPGTVRLGEKSTVTAFGQSPQNRGLTYSYEASAGMVAGNGASAVLTASGAAPGPATITCTVVDDMGKTAAATTVVNVTAPPVVAAVPHARPLCPLSFERDKRRPNRVDNEAKGCLDDIGLTMNRETGAHLLIVGKRSRGETDSDAAERTINTREYLVKEKGLDSGRIEMRIGDASGRTVENTLIPAGATYDPGPVSRFDAALVPRKGRAYGTASAGEHVLRHAGSGPRSRRRAGARRRTRHKRTSTEASGG